MTQATFNPLDLGSNVTLSNSNLTAASTTSALTGVRAQDVKQTGKYYFEITCDAITSDFSSAICMAKASAPLDQLTTLSNCSIQVSKSGLIRIPGNDAGQSIHNLVNGDVVGVAIDLDNGKIWFRKNNDFWNAQTNIGADPATNVNGMPCGFINTAGLVPAVALGASGDQFTANFGQSAFAFTKPTGFTSGWGQPTTWNPADKSSNVSLLNANLSAKSIATSDKGVRATDLKTTGKLYFEVEAETIGGGDTGVGVATPSASLATLGTNATGAAIKYKSGSIWVNGSSIVASATAYAAGTKACIAVDIDNGLFWARVNNGIWNNSGTADPATGTGGLNISAITSGGLYPAAAIQNNNDFLTANFGLTAFSQTVPTGFSAWATTTGHAPVSPASVTEWSSNRSAKNTNITVSSRVVVTHAANTTPGGTVAKHARFSGKFYMESVWTVTGTGGNAFGVSPLGASVDESTSSGKATIFTSGQIRDTTTTTIATVSNSIGQALCAAIDLDNNRAWFRSGSGLWNGSATADPATNTGGIDISGITQSGVFPYMSSATNGAVCTANFGGGTFQQPVPIGFTAGWPVNDDDLQLDYGVATGVSSSGSSNNVTIDTDGPKRLIYVQVLTDNDSDLNNLSISDTAGLSWTKRQDHSFPICQAQVATFWAYAPDQLTGDIISITGQASDSCVYILTFQNADPFAPFDIDPSVPAAGEVNNQISSSVVVSSQEASSSGSGDGEGFAICCGAIFSSISSAAFTSPVQLLRKASDSTFILTASGALRTATGFIAQTLTNDPTASGTLNSLIAADIIRRKTTDEVPSSLEHFSDIAEAASSDAAAEAASSDHQLEHASDERASSDHAAERASDERASSDHEAAEQASSDNVEPPSSEQISSDHEAAEQASSELQSDLGPIEQASSELQSDLTAQPAPPIQVVAIVS